MSQYYYYFAYGSNMNFEQMKIRCPNARFITKAKLNGYKFVYDGYPRAFANIIKSDNHIVEGGLFEIDDDCLRNLDYYEGFPTHYEKQIVEVTDDNHKFYNAIVYLRNPLEPGLPSKEYREIVLKGAIDCGLSDGYIEKFINK